MSRLKHVKRSYIALPRAQMEAGKKAKVLIDHDQDFFRL